MALRPISFPIPERRPSPIEDAFRAGLVAAAGAAVELSPLGKLLEKRRLERELASQKARSELELAQLPKRLELQTEADLKRARGLGEIEISQFFPAAEARTRAALRSTEIQREVPIEPATESTLDRVRQFLGTPATELAAPTTVAEYGQIAPILGEAVQARAAELANLRAGEQMREQKLFSLLAQVTPQAIQELGPYAIRDEQGVDHLLSYSDMGIVLSSNRIQAGKDEPVFRDMYKRLLEIEEARRTGKLIQITQLDPKTLAAETRALTGPDGAQDLPGWAFMAAQLNLLWKTDEKGKRKKITDAGESADYLKRNPDLLQALVAMRHYRDMREVLNAEKIAGTAKLSPVALGYLQRIYRGLGKENWQHPEAINPPDLPPDDASATPTSAARQSLPGASAQVPLPTGGRTAPLVAIEGQSPQYQTLYKNAFARISQDTAQYRLLQERFESVLQDPDSATAFFRKLGINDIPFASGTTQQRRLMLNRFRREALAALQDARDDALNAR